MRVPPSNPLGPAPLRRPLSVRRTSSLQATWPDGRDGPMVLNGRARDLLTDAQGQARTLAEDRLSVRVGRDGLIQSIETPRPSPAALDALTGRHSIAGLRGAIADIAASEARLGSPLYTLLEDIPGVSLVSGWAWTRWPETQARAMAANALSRELMQDICIGFAQGSSSLSGEPLDLHRSRRVPSPLHPHDPQGWHALPAQGGIEMWRIRRIDVWRDGGTLQVDSMFQDSAMAADGGRDAAHEYALAATLDANAGLLIEARADPRILPYAECPGAVANLPQLFGTPLGELRRKVLETLRRTAGCTHLNDALRALAEVPQLAAPLLAR